MSILLDRSRIETRLECRAKRYWQYDHLQKGITLEGDSKHLRIGLALHKGIEWLLSGKSLAQALVAACNEIADRQEFYLIQGMLLGWYTQRLPNVLATYDILDLEKEFNVPVVPGMELMFRRDALVRRKSDNALVVLDYKTLGYYTESWELLHEASLQTLLYTWATEQLSGERCAGIQYEGLVKGKFSHDKGWQSPYMFGYTDGNEWTHKYTAKKGWERKFVGEQFSPMEWAEHLRITDAYEKLFQVTPPRRMADHIIQQGINEVVRNEFLYNEQKVVPQNLEHNYKACYKYGTEYPCQFHGLCFGGGNELKELEIPNGYVFRDPHHEGEME